MKRLSVLLFAILFVTMAAGLPVSAAELPVASTKLARGNAYQSYTGQIVMTDDKDYTFEHVSGIFPKGLKLNRDTGEITDMPTVSGGFRNIGIRITDVATGVSEVVQFSMTIMPRKITVNVTAPRGAVYAPGRSYEATVACYDAADTELTNPLDLTPTLTYGTDKASTATDAGIYLINVKAPSGCTITQRNGDSYLVIEAAQVTTLTVPDKAFPYDGNPHGITEADFTLSPAEAGYEIWYKPSGSDTYTKDLPQEPGTYSVWVHTTNENYQQAEATASLVIISDEVEVQFTLKPGNSPAAMLYQSADGGQTAVEAFKNEASESYRKYQPDGYDEPIFYSVIGAADPDADINTLIVSDINSYTDPGMEVYDGSTTITVAASSVVEDESIAGLYQLIYTYGGEEKFRRSVMEVGRIGDVNGDGFVNAIDANHLDNMANPTPNSAIAQWREWDVVKDGTLNKDDAAAIRKRFSIPLVPYYPWIQ